MSEAWHFYIDEKAGVTRERILEFCEKWKAVLAVREDREPEDATPNPHYHVCFRTPRVYSHEAIRKMVRKLFTSEDHGPKDFGTNKWDENEDLLRYFSKGPGWAEKKKTELPDVVFTTLAPGTIKEFHEEFWEKNEISGKKIKKSKIDLIDEIYGKAKTQKFADWYSAMEFVSGEFIDSLSGKVNDNVLFPLVQSVMWKLDPGAVKKSVFQRMAQKFGPRVVYSPGQQQNLYEDLISHA